VSEATYIRSNHWAAYHSGEWARILTVAPSPERDCYVIEFPNGDTDYWPVEDPTAEYEFKP
jgi:hypothetical protein